MGIIFQSSHNCTLKWNHSQYNSRRLVQTFPGNRQNIHARLAPLTLCMFLQRMLGFRWWKTYSTSTFPLTPSGGILSSEVAERKTISSSAFPCSERQNKKYNKINQTREKKRQMPIFYSKQILLPFKTEECMHNYYRAYVICTEWVCTEWYYSPSRISYAAKATFPFALLTASSITCFGLSEKIWDNMETDVSSAAALVSRLSRSRTLEDGLVANKNDN